jgi:integrase
MSTLQSKHIPTISQEDAARFWSLVQKGGNEHGCWLWTGGLSSKGYGRFGIGSRQYYAHRVSWALAGRNVPTDLHICHTCDNHRCVNPDHLIMADNATNQRDARLKRNLEGKHATIKKPRPDFPLFPHATRRWAKKIRGKMHYFGPTLTDPQGELALLKYLDQKDALHAGRMPRQSGDEVTVRDLLNRFLTTKKHLVDTDELTPRSFADYHRTCDRIGRAFGLYRRLDDVSPEDFEALRREMAKSWGPKTLGGEIQRVRVVFKYGYDAGLLEKPMRYGPGFKRPSAKVLRHARNARGPRMFEAEQLRAMLKAAGVQLRAMLFLGINCGFGNADCGNLPLAAVDLDRGWIDFPRPKTSRGGSRSGPRRWTLCGRPSPSGRRPRARKRPAWCSSPSTARAGPRVPATTRCPRRRPSSSPSWAFTARG